MKSEELERSDPVYLSLGSNVGDRAANLWEAVRRLAQLSGSRLIRLSPLYETEPVGPVPQDWFFNAVLCLETPLKPLQLLSAAKRIEQEMGRAPGERWGPRLIDIDILLYDDLRLESEALVIPHPELWDRRFVLDPLKDVLPDGELRRAVESRLEALGGRGIPI